MEMLLVRRGKSLEQQGKAKGFEASQDQILGEGTYTDPQDQALMMNTPCPYVTQQTKMLGTGFKNEEKIVGSYIRVKEGQR